MDQSRRNALVCLPAETVVNAERMKHLGDVNFLALLNEHCLYREKLSSALGLDVTTIGPYLRYPDSVFVEDPAIIFKDILVITRMGAESRVGEEKILRRALALPRWRKTFAIKEPGTIEGGDVLVTDHGLYIGISKRTNEEGANQLARIIYNQFGKRTEFIPVPEGKLHLKGDVTYHGEQTVIGRPAITVSETLADNFANSKGPGAASIKLIVTPSDERFGANCISRGKNILIHSGKPKTKKILEAGGFTTHEIPMSEAEKIDGALSCFSKIY